MKALTPRQAELMGHLVKGYSSREIAERMTITEKSVTVLRHMILVRLGARHMPQAVYLWLMQRANEIQRREAA